MPENSFCKYYSRMENLIKSNDNHNYILSCYRMHIWKIKNKKYWLSSIKSLQRCLMSTLTQNVTCLVLDLNYSLKINFFNELPTSA